MPRTIRSSGSGWSIPEPLRSDSVLRFSSAVVLIDHLDRRHCSIAPESPFASLIGAKTHRASCKPSCISSTRRFFFRPFVLRLLLLCLRLPDATAAYPFLPVLEALRFLEWIPPLFPCPPPISTCHIPLAGMCASIHPGTNAGVRWAE